ncbi:hypothetical protein KYLE_90 [Pantoea phage Kyle]|uniref:Uncharacterized protein n=1 Tax=Pantoea phage Kyle TaxID=2589665 RepID=A0A514A8N8_9CAUD|nr:hypothetical protein HWC52_gp090 [Pantoea phage Kyle]QDH49619.1 hypothetical protein KYLE_90 [Pantoea phage Kyle]
MQRFIQSLVATTQNNDNVVFTAKSVDSGVLSRNANRTNFVIITFDQDEVANLYQRGFSQLKA